MVTGADGKSHPNHPPIGLLKPARQHAMSIPSVFHIPMPILVTVFSFHPCD
jgi:hypothetical protein